MKKSVYRYPNDKLLVKQSRNHQNRWHGWSFTPRQYGKFQQISPNLWLSSPNGFLWKSKNREKSPCDLLDRGWSSLILWARPSWSWCLQYPIHIPWTGEVNKKPQLPMSWVTLICIYPHIQEDSSLYGGVQFMRVPPNHPSKTMTYIDLLKAMVTWRSSHHDLRNMKSHENC